VGNLRSGEPYDLVTFFTVAVKDVKVMKISTCIYIHVDEKY